MADEVATLAPVAPVGEPLRPLCAAWNGKIRQAVEDKEKKFQGFAREAMAFFNGPYDYLLYRLGPAPANSPTGSGFTFSPSGDDTFPRPSFCMTVNKVSELVQIFGPALYHRNPVRQVNPRKVPELPPEALGVTPEVQQQAQMGQAAMAGDPMAMQQMMDPMAMQQAQMAMQAVQQYQGYLQAVQAERAQDQARATLLEAYLNYTPTALDLKSEFRRAIDEALIKGMGVLWTEVYTSPAGLKMVGSFHDTVDNLLIDPDFESIRDAKWIARKCVAPWWQVEQEHGLPPGSLRAKATAESYTQQGEQVANPDADFDRRRGMTNDLVTYYKVWSKMGVGSRLSGVMPGLEALDVYGQYLYLEICPSCEYPLNLPPEVLAGPAEEIEKRIQWPTPFWADDAWPFTPIIFHEIPREVWPQSHIKPAMGELTFLNWGYSFLAGKVKVACRDFLAIKAQASEEIKKQITQGKDFTVIDLKEIDGKINDLVQFLQHPPFNKELYTVIEGINSNFEKRTGLTELAYGMSENQMRSAEEAAVKGDQVSVRPDDMANRVEDGASELGRKEAFAIRWHLTSQEIVPVLGQAAGQLWDQFVMPSSPQSILHGLEYRIEAGSARKPNKARDASNMQQAIQTLFAPLFQYATMGGDVAPINALITAWAKSLDMEASAFLLSPPPMPAPVPPEGEEQEEGQPEGQPAGGQAA